MICPNCGRKMLVKDTVWNPNEEETYRLRECPDCGWFAHTVEYEVEPNERFEMDWAEHHKAKERKDI